jgi:hypothetical protein
VEGRGRPLFRPYWLLLLSLFVGQGQARVAQPTGEARVAQLGGSWTLLQRGKGVCTFGLAMAQVLHPALPRFTPKSSAGSPLLGPKITRGESPGLRFPLRLI